MPSILSVLFVVEPFVVLYLIRLKSQLNIWLHFDRAFMLIHIYPTNMSGMSTQRFYKKVHTVALFIIAANANNSDVIKRGMAK